MAARHAAAADESEVELPIRHARSPFTAQLAAPSIRSEAEADFLPGSPLAHQWRRRCSSEGHAGPRTAAAAAPSISEAVTNR